MPIDYTEQIKLIALKIRTLRKARKLTVKTLCIICNALDVPLRALIE